MGFFKQLSFWFTYVRQPFSSFSYISVDEITVFQNVKIDTAGLKSLGPLRGHRHSGGQIGRPDRQATRDSLAVHVSPVMLGQLEAATDPDPDDDAVRSGGDSDGVRVHELKQLRERAKACGDSTSGTSSSDIKLNW